MRKYICLLCCLDELIHLRVWWHTLRESWKLFGSFRWPHVISNRHHVFTFRVPIVFGCDDYE